MGQNAGMKIPSPFLILGASCGLAAAGTTSIEVTDTVARAGVRRFGVGLAQHNYYDSAQMMKEMLFRNPGFEGLLYQSVVRVGPGGTSTSAIEDQTYGSWPTGFWAGGSFEVAWSSGLAHGRTGTILNSVAPNRANLPNDPGGSTQGTTYLFATGGEIPANGDYLILHKAETGGTGGAAAFGSWETVVSNGATVTSETGDLPIPTDGRQCVRLTALAASQQATVRGRFDTAQGFVRMDGDFRLAFRAKGLGGANRLQVLVQRGSLDAYLDEPVTLTPGWADYSLPLHPHEGSDVSGSVVVSFSTAQPSEILLDDVSLRQTNSDPGNPTEFRDDVVNALRGLHPGILRYVNWQNLGNSIDNEIAPVFGRMRSGYSVYSTTENNMMPGLHEFLVLCEHLGAEPWYCLPATSSTTEVAHLMDYLGGDTSTPYGAKRARRGHPAKWTEVFPRLHLEFANENWNNTAFRGGAFSMAVPCGNRASEIFGVVKSASCYTPQKFQCILGGQMGASTYNQQLHAASSLHDAFTLAPYMAYRVDSYSNNEELFGPLFAEPEWWSFRPSATSGLMRQALDNLQSSARPVPLAVYEVNLHTTTGAISQTALDDLTPSVGAAIAVADHMLVMLRELGSRDQVFFSLAGYRYTRSDNKTAALWGSVLDMGRTNRKRPHYHAVQMMNEILAGDLLQTTHSGEDRTWNQTPMNRVSYTGAHCLQSFAFRDGTRRALVVFNLDRADTLDTVFTGPNAPTGRVTWKRLTSAHITDHNESSEVVAPVTVDLADFQPEAGLALPPFSMNVLTWTQSPRQAWRYENFGTVAETSSSADAADPDGDGFSNLVEYTLASQPDVNASHPVLAPQMVAENGHRYLEIEIPRNPEATDVAVTVEASTDLVEWSGSNEAVTSAEVQPGLVRIRLVVPPEGAPARFVRLRATAAE